MRRTVTPRLLLLAVAHFTTDAYSSFFPPLLPLLVQKLDLNLTLVGSLIALASVSSSFAQPLFGWLSDRVSRPWFVALGPLVAALFLSSVGLAPSYAMLATLLLIGGLGVAAFHPQGATMAGEQGANRSMAMAIFVSGGTLGFSLGPLLAVGMVGAFGLERTWLAALLGVAMAVLLLGWFAKVTPRPRERGAMPRFAELKPVARPLTLLYFAVVCRSAISYGFMTFLPLWLTGRGVSLAASGALVTLYLFAGALGGFVGGWLAARWGGRRVVLHSFLWSAPLYVAFLFLPPLPGMAALALGSFVMQSSLPVNVVLGQELSPRHSATISSLLMGAAWGVGALLLSPIGALADFAGLTVALLTLAVLAVAGVALALALPDPHRFAAPAEVSAAGAAGK